jgi:2-enoate reductase
MAEDGEQTIRRLMEEHGSWFLDDERLEQGRLSGRLHPFERLFSPVRINSVTLANRIGMAPLGNLSTAEETGRPSERMVRYFAERARGGAGLLISGLVPVGQRVDPSVTEPGGLSYFPRLDRSRSVYTGWRDIASACHAYGAAACTLAGATSPRPVTPTAPASSCS